MENVTVALKKLRLKANLSMAEIAKELGYSHPSGYQRYEDGELYKRDFLPIDLVKKLSTIFEKRGIDPQETLVLAGVSQDLVLRDKIKTPEKTNQIMGVPFPPSSPAIAATGNRDLPVMGWVDANESEKFAPFILSSEAVEYVDRPGNLNGVADGFAVKVYGDSMRPRYRPNTILHVNPRMQVLPGDGTIIELTDGGVMVKEFIEFAKHKGDDVAVFLQYTPKREFSIPRAQIKRLMRVVGTSEV